MKSSTEHFHGSDLEKIEAAYGIKKEELINFSSNVNPLGISENLKRYLPQKIELITTYPDRDYKSLRAAIGKYVQVAPEHILVGNGSTELISLCIKAIQPKKALIIGPTYSEYEREIKMVGGLVTYFPLLEAHLFQLDVDAFLNTLDETFDLLVVCNPNNPTSTAISVVEMERIASACKAYNTYILIDETYVEFAQDVQKITSVSLVETYEQLFIIRGVSKFFAAPGLRLGYAMTSSASLMTQINELKNPWSINALAAFAGELMLIDDGYIEATRNLIATQRSKIIDLMNTWDFVKVVEPTANFILVKILKDGLTAKQLFERLLEQKMMVRDCTSFSLLQGEYFRFCFLMPEENDGLLNAIRTINMESSRG